MRIRVRQGNVDGPVLCWVDVTESDDSSPVMLADVVAMDVLDTSSHGQSILAKALADETRGED